MGGYRNRCYERLAADLGHDHVQVPCTPLPDDDVRVDVTRLLAALDGAAP